MKQVESAIVCNVDTGIIELIINTKDKWVSYHQSTDYEYVIGNNEETGEEDEVFKIDEKELHKDPKQKYFRVSVQEKDQIIYLWIPYSLMRNGRECKQIYNGKESQKSSKLTTKY